MMTGNGYLFRACYSKRKPPSPGNSLLFSVNSLGILLKDVYPLLSLLDLEMVCTFFTYASVSYYSVVWSHLPACDVWKCGIAMCTIIRNSFFLMYE